MTGHRPPPDADAPGPDRIARHLGRYALLAEIGRGGMGAVYRAWDPELSRVIALKVLREGELASEVDRARFVREARAAARLEHPNLVRVYDLGEQDGVVYLTMPLVVGPPLSERIGQGPVAPHQAATWAAALAHALQHAHSAGFVHRDVKPGNILLEGGVRPMLTDFGLVRQVATAVAPLTDDFQLIGTPAYMSPEQARGLTQEVGPLSDQFALGVILTEMITGVRRYPGLHPAEILRRILEEEAPPILEKGLPPALVAICHRATAPLPAHRYPDAGALAEDLERFLRGEPVAASAPSWTRQLRQTLWRKRGPLRRALLSLGAGATGLALYATGSAGWARHASAEREAAAEGRRGLLETRMAALVSSGDPTGADAQFDVFANFEGNAETVALARAWRDRGTSLAMRGDAQGALDAFATAYALARDPSTQRAALDALAAGYREEREWSALRAVTSTLSTQGYQAPERRWARDLSLYARDFAEALTHTTSADEVGLIGRLAQQTRTDHIARQAIPWDTDGDGRTEILLSNDTEPGLVLVDTTDPTLPTRAHISGLPPTGWRMFASLQMPPGAPALALSADPHLSLLRLEGDALVTAGTIGTLAFAALSTDLDGDGAPEHYLADLTSLARLDLDGKGGLRAVPVHSGSDHSSTQTWSLTAADYDGDGRRELVAGTGGWGGYDVRVFHSAPQGLSLLTRRHLGEVTHVATVRSPDGLRIAALQVHDPAEPLNYQVFRPRGRQGEARGIHLLHLSAQGLVETGLLPLADTGSLYRAFVGRGTVDGTLMFSGDLSGDGLDEIVLGGVTGWLIVYLQRPDGSFEEIDLAGMAPLALAQLDADPELELLVRTADAEQRVWVLGAGSDHLPVIAATGPQTEAPPPPADLSEDLQQSWARAEALVRIGRLRPAAARFLSLADLTTTSALAGRARLRAAEILEAAGNAGQAGPLYAEVASDPALAAAAWEGALRCFLADERLSEAAEAARARSKLPDPPPDLAATAARLAQQAAAESTLFDFRTGIDPRWRVQSPTGVRLDRTAGGLRLRARQSSLLMELPVQWSGEPFKVDVTTQVERLDWGSSLVFSLVAPDDARLGEYGGVLARYGGSRVLAETFTCADGPHFQAWDRPGLLVGRLLHLGWAVNPQHGRATCTLEGSDAVDGRTVFPTHTPPLPPGPALLRLAGSADLPGLAQALLEEITITGLQPVTLPQSGTMAAYRALALGQPDEAIAASAGAPRAEAQLVRALALDTLDQREASDAALRAALAADSNLGGELPRLFKTDLDRFEAPLRAALGPGYVAALWSACEDFLTMHEGEAPADEVLSQHLSGLETVPLRDVPRPEDINGLLTLLTRRAAMWRRAGRPSAALRDLDRVLALSAALERDPRARVPDFLAEIHRAQAVGERERALVHLSQGEPSLAMDALLAGLRVSPAPEVFADILSANPELDPLHGQTRWAEIEAARQVWPASAEDAPP